MFIYAFLAALLDPIVTLPMILIGAFVRPYWTLSIAVVGGFLIALALGPAGPGASVAELVPPRMLAMIVAGLIGTLIYRRRMRKKSATNSAQAQA